MRGTKEQNRNKGITLIALIITIIVMLTLVAVTITTAVNGGLFEYAGRAGAKTNEAIVNEQLLASGKIEVNGVYYDSIEEYVKRNEPVADDWYEVIEEMEIEEDVTEYHIKTCEELKMFANAVNAGNDFAGITVYLDKNLDLQGDEDKQWTPIGISYTNRFKGTFDGKNHFISGLYIDKEDDHVGLFGYSCGIIKNVGVTNGYIEGHIVGGIAGSSYDGGLIYNCYNTSEILGYWNAGGIVGYSASNVENCYNSGEVTGVEGDSAGGIAGTASGCNVNSCYNMSSVIGEEGCDFVSGIVGWDEEGGLTITNCYNLGDVVGGEYCAGITAIERQIQNCYNAGNIEGNEESYNITSGTSEVTNCYYLSETTGDSDVEGKVEAKTAAEMKTQNFVTLLNGTQSPAPWKYVQNSYPVLSWQ